MKRQRDARGAEPSAASRSGSAGARKVKAEEELLRLTAEGPVNPDTKDFCGAFAALDVDNSWDHDKFRRDFSLTITEMNDEVVKFDMVGIDPPLANALRRILIAEVPTIAISRVTIYQNTGVIHDENLSHRLGLIPIKFDPDELAWKSADAEFDEQNSIRFDLDVSCKESRRAVYSKDLVWKPYSEEQRQRFAANPPRPVADDIIIAQLRSNQEIECECHCEKGVGKEHAKWSPVCTAYYRLKPDIRITKPITGADAEKLVATCPTGVFDIEDLADGTRRARVADERKCSTCRECLETFDGEEKGIVLGKDKRHFLFSIESTGSIPAPQLFQRALVKLKEKCDTARGVLAQRSA